MEANAVHYTGQTVVWRGPFHMEVPLDFHIFINPEENEHLRETAAMVIAKVLSERYVLDAEESSCIIEDDEEY